MHSDKLAGYLAGSKFKRISTDFPNLAILTKSATSGDIQSTFAHASIGNNFLGETVTPFALTGSLEAPTVVLINIEPSFAVLAIISVS